MSVLSVIDEPRVSGQPNEPAATAPPLVRAAPAIEDVLLDVTIPEQVRDNWCWAAIAAGLGRAFGDDARSQCEIASDLFEVSCCPQRFAPESCDQPQAMDRPLGVHLRRRFEDPRHRTFAFVRAQIRRGFPIVVRIDWNRQGAGHLVVIAGYRREGDVRHLYVCDPETGELSKVRFEVFVSYYKQMGFWDISYETRGRRSVPKLRG
ncbi:MAG TPA: papain-like cysteine protease family protein [Thermoanaerobaculia bacterium]|nr:papain-like cysteine protease family protein [Thermoanaerobaculia bacterium]